MIALLIAWLICGLVLAVAFVIQENSGIPTKYSFKLKLALLLGFLITGPAYYVWCYK